VKFQTNSAKVPLVIGEVFSINIHSQSKIICGKYHDGLVEIFYLERWGGQKYDNEDHHLIILPFNMESPVELKSAVEIILSRRGEVNIDNSRYLLFQVNGYG
jgi:hypothetical protein